MKKIIPWLLSCFGCLLVVDALVLFAYAKFNFGTVVPFFIGIIFLVHAFKWQWITSILNKYKLLKRIWRYLWVMFFVWLTSFVGFVGYLHHTVRNQPSLANPLAVITLGAGVNGTEPTPALANRLDAAAVIIKSDEKVLPIVTGGVGFKRTHSEAYVMANYLTREHGINYLRIQKEEKSTSTEENLQFSKAILHAHHISLQQPIAIVTNDFHTVRANAIARRQGFESVTMVASPTPKSIVFNAWFREYFAFLSGWLLNEY